MRVWVVVRSLFINPNIEDLKLKYNTANLKHSEIIGVFVNEDDARALQEDLFSCYDYNGIEMDVYVEDWEVK